MGVSRHAEELLVVYDRAVDEVYRYLRARCGHRQLAEDLCADTDIWDVALERHHVGAVMAELGTHHRSALVLRYFNGLPVPEVADHLGRTVHATEALLVRARREFRTAYERQEGGVG